MEDRLGPLPLACIRAIVILDPSGHRIFSKYYDSSIQNQIKFEETMFEKASQQAQLAEGMNVIM